MKAYDIETTGLNWKKDKITFVGCADAAGAFEIAPAALADVTETIGHNFKFDYKCLRYQGITVPITEDTLIQASLLPIPEEVGLDLEGLAAHFLHYKPWKIDWKKDKAPSIERIKEHCLNDCKAIYDLNKYLLGRLTDTGQLGYYYKYSLPFHRLLADVEYHGIRVDFTKASALREELGVEVTNLELMIQTDWASELKQASIDYHLMRVKPPIPEQFYAHKDGRIKSEKQYTNLKNKKGWVGKYGEMPSKTLKFDLQRSEIRGSPPTLNLGSHAQLRTFLSVLGVFLTDKDGKSTTNKHEMEYHVNDHPSLCQLLSYRDSIKQISFLESWEKYRDGDRIHTNYNMAGRDDKAGAGWKRGARTGRLTSSEPNLQQVDKRMRSLFLPDEGHIFVGGDFGQIEMRLIAHFCEDNRMRDIFRKGLDFYGAVAKELFGLKCHANAVKEEHPDKRQISKMISLAIPYGMWAGTLSYKAKLANIDMNEETAREYLNEWYKIYRGVRAYKMKLGKFALERGYIRSIYGRKIWIPREEAEHKALDYRCQSSGHEMTAHPQIAIQEAVKGTSQLTFLLHDEIWYNCPNRQEDIDKLKGLMIEYMVHKQHKLLQLAVPLEIEIEVITDLGQKK